MHFRIHFDGACDNGMFKRTGKYSPMGIGVAVFINNEYQPDLSKFVGIEGKDGNSSNIAEWMGCVEAFKLAVEYKEEGDTIEIVSDSEVITKQFNGEYEIREEKFKPHYRGAMKLYHKIGQLSLKIKWVPREQNKEADRLSKLGIKQFTGLQSIQ
jgi:ribonuclease HI